MANEITINLTVNVSNGEYKYQFSKNSLVTQAVVGAASGIASIGTSEENLSLGDVATNGFLLLQNLDSTNYVDYGLDDASVMKSMGRLMPTEIALLRLKPGINVRMLANTAAVKVNYCLLNN